MNIRALCSLSLLITGICAGCANITSPTGGKKDKTPPKLVSVSPADSLLNTRTRRIELYFNEYITVNNAVKEVQISPMLSIDPVVTGLNKHVVVKIADSLLEENTTYRLSFGNAIQDLHEGNPFKGYTYTFSTGPYFDSLQLRGTVINAATGLPDTGAVIVVLYGAAENDSAVVRHKPKYIAQADNKGAFVFKGLPPRRFRIYAVKDVNGNFTYDGPMGGEMIAFVEERVLPGDTSVAPVKLRMFLEALDTAGQRKTNSLAIEAKASRKAARKDDDANMTYSVGIDSSNADRRTFDITKPAIITFNRPPVVNTEKIRLSYDNAGTDIPVNISVTTDPANAAILRINAAWQPDKVYTLRLAKGFAKDTSGAEVMPSRYTFRTFDEDDYGKITLNLPQKYVDPQYVLLVRGDKDTVYNKPIDATSKILTRLRPAKYTFCIIVDKNRNGKWDSGDLFEKRQPEEVIPYNEVISLKAGFEHIIDFEQKPVDKKPAPKK